VTPLTLDVTNGSQIQRAVDEVDTLDVLINNAGIAIYDDLSNLDVLEQTSRSIFSVCLKVTNAFLAAAETLQRGHRQRLVPGRARSPTDHTFLLSIKGRPAQLDAVTESALGRPRRDGPCSRPRPRGHRYEPRLQHTESPRLSPQP